MATANSLDMPVLLTTPLLRPALSRALRKVFPRIAVISIAEVPSSLHVQTLGRVGLHAN